VTLNHETKRDKLALRR